MLGEAITYVREGFRRRLDQAFRLESEIADILSARIVHLVRCDVQGGLNPVVNCPLRVSARAGNQSPSTHRHDPDLAAIVQDQLVAPRTAQMRDLFERAVARGEIAPGRKLDTSGARDDGLSTHDRE